MKQISLDDVMALINSSNFELQSTHDKLCFPIIARMYKKMTIGIKFSGIDVCEGMIINGHHRYLASQLAGIQLDFNPYNKTSATKLTDWKSVVLVEEDWYTEADIRRLNEIDALVNNISIEEISKQLE
jgi:hypothetical protein